MRAVFAALRIVSRTQNADVLHHRIVPRDKLLGELTCLNRCDLVAKMPVDIHVTPTP
jgi:hypothetical protein